MIAIRLENVTARPKTKGALAIHHIGLSSTIGEKKKNVIVKMKRDLRENIHKHIKRFVPIHTDNDSIARRDQIHLFKHQIKEFADS